MESHDRTLKRGGSRPLHASRLPRRNEVKVGMTRKEMMSKFEALLSKLDAEIISTDKISIPELRKRYFEATPPFGKGEKKHEFPDAMTILALQDFAVVNATKIYTVSGDNDIRDAVKLSPNLEHARGIPEVTSLVLKHLDRTKAVAEAAETVTEVLYDQLATQISIAFEQSSFYIEDEDGDVEELKVGDVHFLRFYLVRIEEQTVEFEFSAEVSFSANVTYNDPDQTAYDSETGETIVFGYQKEQVHNRVHVEGQIEISLDLQDLQKSVIQAVWIYQPDFGISVHQ